MIHHVNDFIFPDEPVSPVVPFITTVITHQILPGETLSFSTKDAMLNIAIEQDIRQTQPGSLIGAMAAVVGASINKCSLIDIQISDYIVRELALNPVYNYVIYGVPRKIDELTITIDYSNTLQPSPNNEPWPFEWQPIYNISYGWYLHHLSFIYNTISFFASYFSLKFAQNHKILPTEEEMSAMYYSKLPLFWMLFYIYFIERIRVFEYFVPVPCFMYGFGVYFNFQLESAVGPVRNIDIDNQRLVAERLDKGLLTTIQTIYTKYASHTCLMSTLGEEIAVAFSKNQADPFQTFIDKVKDSTTVLKDYTETNEETGKVIVTKITVEDMMTEVQSFYNICKSLNISWLYNVTTNDPIKLENGIPISELSNPLLPIYDDYNAFKNIADQMWEPVSKGLKNIFTSATRPASSIACIERKKDTGVWGTIPHDLILQDARGESRLFINGNRPPFPENGESHYFWDLTAAGTPTILSTTSMNYDQSQLFPDGMKFVTIEEAMVYHVMNCCPYYVCLNRLTCAQGSGGFTQWGKAPIYTATLINRIPGMYYKHKIEVIIDRLINNTLDILKEEGEDKNNYNILENTEWIQGFNNQIISGGGSSGVSPCE